MPNPDDTPSRDLQVRITSDGTPYGTEVFDKETGRRLTNVKSAAWQCEANGQLSTVTLVLEGPWHEVDLVGVASTKEQLDAQP